MAILEIHRMKGEDKTREQLIKTGDIKWDFFRSFSKSMKLRKISMALSKPVTYKDFLSQICQSLSSLGYDLSRPKWPFRFYS